MNVTIHTIAGVATASVLSQKRSRLNPSNQIAFCVTGFILGVVEHGVLDIIPHKYPIPSLFDVILGSVLYLAALIFTRKRQRLLVTACFCGAVAPDVIDLGPALLNHRFGLTLPVVKICPWHWHQFSGSIYAHQWSWSSFLAHAFVLLICFWVLYRHRGVFDKTGESS